MANRASLHRQHRPAMAFGNHGVLQLGRPAPHDILQTISPLLAQALPLQTQARQGRAGAVSHPAALLKGELETLLQLREGGHGVEQLSAQRSQIRVNDLTAQPACSSQGVGHLQQLLSIGNAALAAAFQHRIQVVNPLETEPTLGDPIEARQLNRAG